MKIFKKIIRKVQISKYRKALRTIDRLRNKSYKHLEGIKRNTLV